MWMSLSIVFGTPTTLIFSRRRSTVSEIDVAADRVPSPPIMKSTPMFMRSSASTISSMSCGPRLEPIKTPAALVNVDHLGRGERHRVVAVARDEAAQTVAHPEDVAHPVPVVQLQHDGADDVVQPGAEAAAGDQRALQLARVVEDVFPRARQFVGRGVALFGRPAGALHVDVDENAIVVRDERGAVGPLGAAGDRAGNSAVTQAGDRGVACFHLHCVHTLR